MRNYLQHGRRHAPSGSDPIVGGEQGSAYAQQNIGTTTTIPNNTSVAITWDNVAVDGGGVFAAGSGSTPWDVNVPGQYQVLLAITPDTTWPVSGQIALVPDGLTAFNISEGGMFSPNGGNDTIMLTGFIITGVVGTLPAGVQIRVFNRATGGDLTIVGGNVIAIMNRLGPQVP